MIKSYSLLILKNFSRRRLRSWLTVLGILIGITAVVALVSLSMGMQNAITEQFEKLGANRIIVNAGGAFLGPAGAELTTAGLTDKDIRAIKRVSGVEFAVGILSQTARVDFDDEVEYLSVFGVPVDSEARKVIETASFFQIEKGRHVKSSDRYKVDVGYSIAKDTFERELRVGNKLLIEGKEFEIVGIRKEAGTGVHDVALKIPLETAREIFEEEEKLSMIFVLAKENIDVDPVVEDIKKELRKERDVKEGEEDFTVQTAQQVIGVFQQVLGVVQAILIGIAAISLLVGGIGIMNTMYTSVLERTREIGIMKALGAKSKQIALLFLIESGMIAIVGGIAGILCGAGIGKVVQYMTEYYGITLKPEITFSLVVFTLVFSFLVGMIAGVAPAIRAARLNPIDTIRRY